MTELEPTVAALTLLASERLRDAAVAVLDARDFLAVMNVGAPYLSTIAVDLFDWHHDLGRLAGPGPDHETQE